MAEFKPHGPLEQFEIHRIVPMKLGGLDLSFTNSALFMVVALTLVTGFLIISPVLIAAIESRNQ